MALTNATTLADYGAGIGTQGTTLKVDANNKRVGVGTTNPQGPEGSLQVGTGITFFGNTGIVSAIGGKFSGDFTVGGTLTYEDVSNIDAVGIITAQSHVSIADSILHTGDTDTSIRFPAANTFTVETGGTEALRVDSSQRLLLGLTAARSIADGTPKLQVEGTAGTASLGLVRNQNNSGGSNLSFAKSRSASLGGSTIVQDDDTLGSINFAGADGTDINSIAASIIAAVDGTPGSNDMPGRLTFSTTSDGAAAATERLRIDRNGRILKTGTDARANFFNSTWSPGIQSENTDDKKAALSLVCAGDNANQGILLLGNTRNASVGGNTIVQDDDGTGIVSFQGNDGSDMVETARIEAKVDGTPGANDMPGRLVFRTTADGASSSTERLRIASHGNIGVTKTPKEWFNSYKTIQLLNAGYIAGSTDDSFVAMGANNYLDTGGTYDYTNSDFASQLYQVNGELIYRNASSGTADAAITWVERLRIDSSGRLLIGSDTVQTLPTESRLQLTGTDFATSSIRMHRSESGTSGPSLLFVHTRGTVSSPTVLGQADEYGKIRFYGHDGTDVNNFAAEIKANVDGTPGTDDTPGRLVFSTTADGSNTVTERMRIDSAGNTMFGTTDNAVAVQNSDLGVVLNGGDDGRIYATANSHHDFNRTSDGEIIRFRSATNTEGAISVSGSTVTYGQFCGSHWGRLEDSSKPEILPGTILETINKSVEWKVIEFTVDGVQKLQAYNGSEEIGASVTVEYEGVTYTGTVADEAPDSDALNKHVCVKVSDTAASKAVFGVFLGWDEEEDDKMIGIWNDMNIAAIGNYFIRIKSGQSLEIGDLIESDGTGCGVVQSDDIIRSKTVAKVTSTTSHKVYTDGSFLVTCVLYSG